MDIQIYLHQIVLPGKASHKGENGRLLIIGGSDLFHAASAWSLEAASKIVDVVLYSSVTENNALVKEAKKAFWDGIVVPRGEVESYVKEADCILIGPGMTREEGRTLLSSSELQALKHDDIDWEHDTYAITNYLLSRYGDKRWVIDAGALQMMNPALCTPSMVLTPHPQEFERVFGMKPTEETITQMSKEHQGVSIVVKGVEDIVSNGTVTERVSGGNEGMTKGGTGDVLAGLIASFYCKSGALASTVVGSYINKKAGDALYTEVGQFFNTSDLVKQIPHTLHGVLGVR